MSDKSRLANDHAFEYFEKNVFKLPKAASYTIDYEIAMRVALMKLNLAAENGCMLFSFC